jgi:CHAD domain-containing protein
MRVGLRRLRAAMSLFSTLLHDPQAVAIKAELKLLTGGAGIGARDLQPHVDAVLDARHS